MEKRTVKNVSGGEDLPAITIPVTVLEERVDIISVSDKKSSEKRLPDTGTDEVKGNGIVLENLYNFESMSMRSYRKTISESVKRGFRSYLLKRYRILDRKNLSIQNLRNKFWNKY